MRFTTRVGTRLRAVIGLAAVGLAVAVTSVGGTAAVGNPTILADTQSVASTAQVLKLVAQSAKITKVPSSLTPSLENSSNDTGFNMVGPKNCEPSYSQTTVKVSNCIFGDKSAKHTIVILGDSHAAMWLPAFDLIGKRISWRIIDFNKVNCGAAYIEYYLHQESRNYTECDTWHQWVIGQINKLDPSIVVLTSLVVPADSVNYPMSPSAWTAGLDKTLGLITSTGTEKVILGDIPYLTPGGTQYPGFSTTTPAECLAAHESSVSSCSVPVGSGELTTFHQAEVQAASQGDAQYINVIPWFCSAVCTPIIGNYEVYSDVQHITATYSKYLSGALQATLQTDITAASAK